ncbi:DNA polymerase epsilon subunit 2 [Athalia rosae]|uniref:DNA polymerase epsilon subunit 2 n=1 Tax=Athalia rosae TaxID=37344 RepID=UPI00203402F6|nr:DNA polymerase epsilon subunit 2 [Athalia rosae]
MQQDKIIKSIQSTFKLSGLSISRECCARFVSHLRTIDEELHNDSIRRITESLLSQNLIEPLVTLDHLEIAITECALPRSNFEETETVLNVLNVSSFPKISYDLQNKKFIVDKPNYDLFSDSVNKSKLFKERLELIWYRTLKNEHFAPLEFGLVNSNHVELRRIEYLLGSSKVQGVYVMGVLTQLTDGHFYLEDVTGVVKIDLSKAKYQAGLITEGCIVLATGDYDQDVLDVKALSFPPSEPSDQSRTYFGKSNTFGGPHPVSLKISEKLKSFEEAGLDETIIFISELWVDDQIVLEKFKTMIHGYAISPPRAFIICGNFLSFPPNITSTRKLEEGFKNLAEIVSRYPEIAQHSKFVLVPGPDDPGSPKILPRAPLPSHVIRDFMKEVPDVILATNPCRIQYCTKEIIVFRENILTKVCRNTLYFNNDNDIPNQYARSIISQSHLTPMNLIAVPIYWNQDHALQLYPTPDLVVVADQYKPYSTKFNDCHVINPGVFSKNDFPFMNYYPADNKIEESSIGKGEDTS